MWVAEGGELWRPGIMNKGKGCEGKIERWRPRKMGRLERSERRKEEAAARAERRRGQATWGPGGHFVLFQV